MLEEKRLAERNIAVLPTGFEDKTRTAGLIDQGVIITNC
jgi:hypothetical protein